MIATRDRISDLRRTCEALKRLDPQPAEILITADGCTDGTSHYVQEALPQAKLFINATGRGSVASRDHMLRQTSADYVLSLDDDSYPEQLDCVDRLRRLFHERPRLAVAHFPQRTDEYPETLTQTDFGPARLTGSFANSGACFRRQVYLSLPGFCTRFFHMYEEPDYALQCIAAEYEVLISPVLTIRHHFSFQARSERCNHQRHARNEFWSALMRCPLPYVAGVVLYRVVSQARYACRRGRSWLVREPAWWWAALSGMPRCLRDRHVVSWNAYRKWVHLLRQPQELPELKVAGAARLAS